MTRSNMGYPVAWDSVEGHGCAQKVSRLSVHPTSYFLMDMARRYNFQFLDNFSIYYERGDLSFVSKPNGLLDCTHHCYTPEVIWPELVLLTKLIKY